MYTLMKHSVGGHILKIPYRGCRVHWFEIQAAGHSHYTCMCIIISGCRLSNDGPDVTLTLLLTV